MKEAKQHLDSGNLSEAVNSVLGSVKKNPTDAAARTFLFELSCFSGDWDRAEKQLDVIGHQDANAMMGSLIYRGNFSAERDRMKHFADGTLPEIAMELPEYVKDLLKANELLRAGKTLEARSMLDAVEDARPAFPCTVNGIDRDDFRDYNDLTMCVFEAIVKDSYVWLPFEQVEKIEFLDRKSLRDIYWLHASFELTNGTNGEMFVPSLYVNSWKHSDDQVRLGRAVDWRDAGEDIYIGEGSRLYSAGGEELSILDIKSIEFKHE